MHFSASATWNFISLLVYYVKLTADWSIVSEHLSLYRFKLSLHFQYKPDVLA